MNEFKGQLGRNFFSINKRKFSLLLIGLPFFWVVGSYLGAIIATLPNPKTIPPATEYFNSPVEDVTFITSDGIQIAAWYWPNSSRKSVVLMNGYRHSRLRMVDRAKLYYEKGYSVLLPDLRGTGESDMTPITIGWKERHDLKAACRFLKEKGKDSIAVHGISLGAATIAYSLQDEPDYSFAVLESCYDNLEQTFQNRIDHFYVPAFLIPLLKYWTEKRIGATAKEMSPESYLKQMKCPVLFVAGDKEYKVKKTETESIFKNCGSPRKELHFFKGARHEDFLKYDKEEFEQVLLGFLASLGEE